MKKFSDYCHTIFELSRNIKITGHDGSLALDEGAMRVVAMLSELRAKGKKVMVIGNGGSAAIAGHMQNDLAKAAGIRSLAFQDISLLTAMANDHGYDAAYVSGVVQWAEKGDLLIAISSSGESENMLLAVQAARKANCQVVTLTGFLKDNNLRKQGDVNFFVPVVEYGYVETIHSILAHYLTDMVKEQA